MASPKPLNAQAWILFNKLAPLAFRKVTIKAPTGKTVPLAVHVRGAVTHDQITMPKILTGVY